MRNLRSKSQQMGLAAPTNEAGGVSLGKRAWLRISGKAVASGPAPGGRAPAAFRGGLLSEAPGPRCSAPRVSSPCDMASSSGQRAEDTDLFQDSSQGSRHRRSEGIDGAMAVLRGHTSRCRSPETVGPSRAQDLQASVPPTVASRVRDSRPPAVLPWTSHS